MESEKILIENAKNELIAICSHLSEEDKEELLVMLEKSVIEKGLTVYNALREASEWLEIRGINLKFQ